MIRTIALAGLAVSFAAAAADIQKCADSTGRITYQDSPCPRGATIGAVPRDSAKADPAALRELARERARIERVADAQFAPPAPQQPLIAPVPVPAQPNAVGVAGEPVYTTPVYSVDPTTGAVIAPGSNVAAGVNQPIVPTPSPITQPPTEVPGTGAPLTPFPAQQGQGAAQSPAVIQLPSGTQSPAIIQAPPSTTNGASAGIMVSPATSGGRGTGR